jgi:hypothetical protein
MILTMNTLNSETDEIEALRRMLFSFSKIIDDDDDDESTEPRASKTPTPTDEFDLLSTISTT